MGKKMEVSFFSSIILQWHGQDPSSVWTGTTDAQDMYIYVLHTYFKWCTLFKLLHIHETQMLCDEQRLHSRSLQSASPILSQNSHLKTTNFQVHQSKQPDSDDAQLETQEDAQFSQLEEGYVSDTWIHVLHTHQCMAHVLTVFWGIPMTSRYLEAPSPP